MPSPFTRGWGKGEYVFLSVQGMQAKLGGGLIEGTLEGGEMNRMAMVDEPGIRALGNLGGLCSPRAWG